MGGTGSGGMTPDSGGMRGIPIPRRRRNRKICERMGGRRGIAGHLCEWWQGTEVSATALNSHSRRVLIEINSAS